MILNFRFVLKKSVFLHLRGWPVTHQSLNVDPTRPATGAGRLDRFQSLLLITFNDS